MSKEAMNLRTAAEKVVELCSERPLSLGKWFIDMSEACESLREALAKPDFWEGYVPEPVKSGEGASATVTITLPAQQALDKKAENARELGLDYEPAQKPVTPCTHPSLGFSSLREDGAASRWSCVMCGTEFVPKATQRWTEFNETTKRNIEHAEWYLSTHPEPAQQEPVARQYQNRDGVWKDFISEKHYKDTLEDGSWPIRNLYTSPPAQRTWVSLTDKEIGVLWFEANDQDNSMIKHFARAIEAKLRSKNEDRN
jgi:hypothetical protein